MDSIPFSEFMTLNVRKMARDFFDVPIVIKWMVERRLREHHVQFLTAQGRDGAQRGDTTAR